jgi:hypothetical protein
MDHDNYRTGICGSTVKASQADRRLQQTLNLRACLASAPTLEFLDGFARVSNPRWLDRSSGVEHLTLLVGNQSIEKREA